MSPVDQLFPAGRKQKSPAIMSWHTIDAPYIIELAGQTGVDAVMLDMQHGTTTKTSLVNCLTAARAANVPALVRAPELTDGVIGQILDAGAQGVICPMVNDADDATKLVEAVKYPPLGKRSYGPYRGKLLVNKDYFTTANNWTLACAQIETRQSLQNIDEILSVEGLDMILVGPNDLAISLSDGKSRDIESPELQEALRVILHRAKQHNVATALFANNWAFAKPQLQAGWDLMSIGTDSSIYTAGLSDLLQRAQQANNLINQEKD